MRTECLECGKVSEIRFDELPNCCTAMLRKTFVTSFLPDEFCQIVESLRSRVVIGVQLHSKLQRSKFLIPHGWITGEGDISNELASLLLVYDSVSVAQRPRNRSPYFDDLVERGLVHVVQMQEGGTQDDTVVVLTGVSEANMDDSMFAMIFNLEEMLRHINDKRQQSGALWAHLTKSTVAHHGMVGLVLGSDIIHADAFPPNLERQIKDEAESLGLSRDELISKSGVESFSVGPWHVSQAVDERDFLFDLGLSIPGSISVEDLVAFRQEGCVVELVKELETWKTLTSEERTAQTTRLIKSVTEFNRETDANFQTKCLFLRGIMSTLGGLVGGPPGAAIGGVGSSIAVYTATKHRERRRWMQHLARWRSEARS